MKSVDDGSTIFNGIDHLTNGEWLPNATGVALAEIRLVAGIGSATTDRNEVGRSVFVGLHGLEQFQLHPATEVSREATCGANRSHSIPATNVFSQPRSS